MPSSKPDHPSSMYVEHGSAYKSGGYSNSTRSRSSNGDDYATRRNSESYHGYGDYRRGRDHRQGGRNERHSRDDAHSSKRDSRRDRSYDRNTSKSDRNNSGRSSSKQQNNGRSSSSSKNHNNGRSSSLGMLERLLPSDFRPSQADPEARHHRLSKEKECEGFDWTPGIVLGLIGATALFSVEKSLVRRRKKEYIE